MEKDYKKTIEILNRLVKFNNEKEIEDSEELLEKI
jgi:hypothetical protein